MQKFLPFVLASTYRNQKIYIADNGSTDDSVLLLQHHFSQVEIILLEKNYGFAEGYNQALRQISADYYILLNSDVEVTPGWIEPVISLMESDKKLAACQPKMLSWNKKEYFEYAGAAGGWIDFLGYPFARGRVFNDIEKDEKQYEDIQYIFWASGAAMFVRSELYHREGGLDGSFFAHQEEIDFCWRLQRAGYHIGYCPSSTVYHVGGGTLPKGHSWKTFLNFRNNLIMLSKNLVWRERLWKIPVRMLLDIVFAFKCLFSGDQISFKAIFKAHWQLTKWWFKKKNNTKFRKISMDQLDGVVQKSIVWAYFIQGKKRFKEIVGFKHT